jgi:carboxylesterase
MERPFIMPGAEPYYLPGNKTGCLMIHGFTGTPKELRWMGEYLNRQGYTVYGIRLSGHATQISDLVRSHWQDWVLSVEDGIDVLRTTCNKVYTLGLSMGGILSLLAAHRYEVNAAVAMSTPYSLPTDWRLRFARQFSTIYSYVSKGPGDLKDDKAKKGHLDYDAYPTHAIAELNDLIVELHRILPEIKKPVLIIHSKADNISYENSIAIQNMIGSQDKELLLLEKSGHVITEDIERMKVFDKAAQFIQRINKIK